MPAPSRRRQVLEATLALLEQVRPDTGFRTDLGLRVHYGIVEVTEDDQTPVALLRVGAADVLRVGNRVEWTLPLTVQVLTRADKAPHPLAAVEDPLDDIVRVVLFRLETTLRAAGDFVLSATPGAVRTIDREPGGAFVAAEVDVTVRVLEDYPAVA